LADINDDKKIVRHRAEVTGVVRRPWSDEAKGRIVAEAIAPGDVAAEVARRHDLAPQHLWNWIRAAKEGRFSPLADEVPAFVPVISVESAQPNEPAQESSFCRHPDRKRSRHSAGAGQCRGGRRRSGLARGSAVPTHERRHATQPLDFRKSVNRLAALVQEQLRADPFSGMIYSQE
jgi:transposase-like protein